MKLRSLLFVPGDSEKKAAKAAECGADALIFDLEDSVAEDRKDTARSIVAELISPAHRGWSAIVRVNPFDGGRTAGDLAAVVRPGLDANWNGRPFRTNSHGHRSPEVSVEKPPGTYRVVVLGSSNSMGARSGMLRVGSGSGDIRGP